MNIAIVDDSASDRAQLRSNIEEYAKESNILVQLKEYKSGEEFLGEVQDSLLDVVFLDIFMNKINGMEVAHAIRRMNTTCQIVFITTSSAYAVESYQVRAFHYILKPYTYADITAVLNLLDKTLQKSSRYIKVKEGREWCKIFLSDILYVDYNNHYVQLHTESAIVSTYMKFPEMEEKLSAYPEFLCCYRCIIVNMKKIKKVEDLFFLMCNGEYIPINRKRIKELKGIYADYIFGEIEGDS